MTSMRAGSGGLDGREPWGRERDGMPELSLESTPVAKSTRATRKGSRAADGNPGAGMR